MEMEKKDPYHNLDNFFARKASFLDSTEITKAARIPIHVFAFHLDSVWENLI